VLGVGLLKHNGLSLSMGGRGRRVPFEHGFSLVRSILVRRKTSWVLSTEIGPATPMINTVVEPAVGSTINATPNTIPLLISRANPTFALI